MVVWLSLPCSAWPTLAASRYLFLCYFHQFQTLLVAAVIAVVAVVIVATAVATAEATATVFVVVWMWV